MELRRLENSYRTHFITQSEYNTLTTFYSQSVPFKGTSGKYSISPVIVYPRYKIRAAFEAYNQNSVSKRSIAKNESYADYAVLPLKQFRQILIKRNTNYSPNVNHPLHGQIHTYNFLNTSEIAKFTTLIDYYKKMSKEESPKPMIDFEDFSSNLDALKERLTVPKTEYIINLLKGDKSSVKLGMELLTNFDTARSIIAICYCLSQVSVYNIKTNDYFNSTAFKSFKDRFISVTGNSIEVFGGINTPRLYDHIVTILNKNEDANITATEYQMFKDAMCEHYIERANNDDVTLNITPDNVILKIDENQIISDESIEEEDRLRQEAALEDASSSYYLLDDTTETA